MRDIATATLSGNLTRDVELRSLPSGANVARLRVVVDAELDWREWIDPDDKKREAVTFRARQVLFEGGRPTSAGTEDRAQQDGAGAEATTHADGESVGVSTEGTEGSASADDLPF